MMMFLLLNLLQSQQGRLSRVVIIGAVLVFIAGVSLLVYFYRRYKRVEKESEDDWDSSRHSLFVNVPPSPAQKAEGASSQSSAEIKPPAPETVPAEARGTLEFASEIELPSPVATTAAEPRAEAPLPPEEPIASAPPEHRPTEVLASPSLQESTAKTEAEHEPMAFDEEIWAGLEVGEQPPIAREHLTDRTPLAPTPEPPRVARVDQPSHREPFEAPRIERILHREPYDSPRIEPLTPREQAAARDLKSMQPPSDRESKEPAPRETVLFGSASERRSSTAPGTEAPDLETREPAATARVPEPSLVGSHAPKSYRAPAGSVLGLPAEPSHQPLILGDPVRPDSETGIGALSNYGKDIDQKTGPAGTIVLLVVVALLSGAVALYLFVPSIHSRVSAFVAQVRGTDTLAAREAAMKPRAQIIPSYRPEENEVNKNMVTARGAVDNISDQPLENLAIEVSLKRGGDAPPDVRTVSVTPNPLPPGERGTFEFEYDGKRGRGFAGYTITRLLSNGTEVKFRIPGQK